MSKNQGMSKSKWNDVGVTECRACISRMSRGKVADAMGLHAEFLHMLDDLNELGLAIVLSTHDLNGIAAHLPHLVCLNRSVMGVGSAHEVLTPALLEATYGAPMDVLEHAGLPFVVDRMSGHGSRLRPARLA